MRPQISLFGEMLDAQMIAEIARQLEKADVLILLGTGIDSEVFKNYIKYYKGNKLAVIHTQEELKDKRADLVIYDEPVNVLAQLIN